MPFTSLIFLTAFLPVFLLTYWLSPTRLKNAVALAFSIAFYGWGAPKLLVVILGIGVLDFYLSRAVAASEGKTRKRLVVAGVVMHLAVLCYFKYANFFVHEFFDRVFPKVSRDWRDIALPIGISFLTFEEISALVDVYRGDAKPAKRLSHYLLFLMLFPHSIAGPIFRWKDLEKQLETRSQRTDDILKGFERFIFGLGKKVLIANAVAVTSDAVFGMPSHQVTPWLAWAGAIAYTLQIYFDFSGYSDMAIGLGLMMGFRFKENFNHPYLADSITDFWKRWHISLSTWIRDYLYIPLGGNRGTPRRARINLFLSFFLSGFWHGANWTFLAWGAYHGGLVLMERTSFISRARAALPKYVQIPLTCLLVLVGWVFFRAQSMRQAFGLLIALANPFIPRSNDVAWGEVIPYRTLAAAILGIFVVVLPLFTSKRERTAKDDATERSLASTVLVHGLGVGILLLSLAFLANSKFEPMIYFRF